MLHKNIFKRAAAAAFAFVTAASSLNLANMPARAFTYSGDAPLGSAYYTTQETVSPGLVYTRLYIQNQNAYVLEYDPAASGTDITASGNKYVWGLSTVKEIADYEASNSSANVTAAVNADFYSMKTGVPLGLLVDGGKLLSSSETKYALALTYGGRAIIGDPGVKVTLTSASGKTTDVDYYNKYPTEWGAYLLNGDFAASTKSSSPSTEIVIRPDGAAASPSPSCEIKGAVTAVYRSVADTAIPDGCFVLSFEDGGTASADFAALKTGDKITLDFSCSPGWENPKIAVGGGDILVKDGAVVSGIEDEEHEKYGNPRTAAGITNDGKVLFFAVDGREGKNSGGLTLNELAKTMLAMGCVTALNFDGGGSTTVMVKRFDASSLTDSLVTVNVPSDGYQRRVSDALLFVNTVKSTGIASALSLSPQTPAVNAGSKAVFTAYLRDPSGKLLGAAEKGSVVYSLSDASMGTVTSDGTFVSSGRAGTVTLTAITYAGGRNLSASAKITVMQSLTDFDIKARRQTIPSGGSVKFDITGLRFQTEVITGAESFKWTVSAAKPIADQQNAVQQNASVQPPAGAIASSAAGYIDGDGVFHAYENAVGTVTLTASYGYKTQNININVGMPSVLLEDFEADQSPSRFTGTVSRVKGGKCSRLGAVSDYALRIGKTLTYAKPLALSDGAVSVSLWAQTAGADANPDIKIMLRDANGRNQEIAYKPAETLNNLGWTRYTAEIPDALKQPLTVVSPVSSSSSSSLTVDDIEVCYGESEKVFADTAGHWAENYILLAYDMQIADGIASSGGLLYSPENTLTRAQFAKMLASYLNLKTGTGATLKQTFADASVIDGWAAPYVEAVVSAGLMRGRAETGGTYFRPGDSITRAEVMQVFGSLLGNAPAALTYTDAAQIPDWAKTNVGKTTAAKIILGYSDGTLRPLDTVTRAEIAVIFARINDYGLF